MLQVFVGGSTTKDGAVMRFASFAMSARYARGTTQEFTAPSMGNTRVLSGKRRPGDKAMGYKEFMTQK